MKFGNIPDKTERDTQIGINLYDMSITDKIILGAIGGLFTAIFFPIINFFIPRLWNKGKIKISITSREEGSYKVFNILIKNRSIISIKNVSAYVTINNTKNDIQIHPRISFFCTDAKVEYGMLSWSKNTDYKNLPELDINQGDRHQINFVRVHNEASQNIIEVASEQGFFDEKMRSTARVVLRANRNYTFCIKVTGDNLWPKSKRFYYKYSENTITEEP
jgi:hypothetical protein